MKLIFAESCLCAEFDNTYYEGTRLLNVENAVEAYWAVNVFKMPREVGRYGSVHHKGKHVIGTEPELHPSEVPDDISLYWVKRLAATRKR